MNKTELKKIHHLEDFRLEEYDFTVDQLSYLWTNTIKKLYEAKIKAKNDREFKDILLRKFYRVKQKDKILYNIAVLRNYFYYDIARIYESEMLAKKLIKKC